MTPHTLDKNLGGKEMEFTKNPPSWGLYITVSKGTTQAAIVRKAMNSLT